MLNSSAWERFGKVREQASVSIVIVMAVLVLIPAPVLTVVVAIVAIVVIVHDDDSPFDARPVIAWRRPVIDRRREKARIQHAQNAESRRISALERNGVTGNPTSASSQRMQADVQRNINEQNRIEQGIRSGQLTNREVGKLERGQARVNRLEARAGADGHVGAREQRRIQMAENHQSNHIFHDKHNGHVRH